LKKEIQILLTAFMFYTQFPIGKWVKYDKDYLSKSIKYLPIVGWVVGLVIGGVYSLSTMVFSPFVSLVFSLIAGVLVTGAFHEDGFADVCDGFGGGWTKEKILTIMKDSRVGVYGATGLVLLFSLKGGLLFDAYHQLEPIKIIGLTVLAHTISRFIASTFLITHQYARSGDDSKARDATSENQTNNIVIGGVLALMPILLYGVYFSSWMFLLLIIPCYLTKIVLGNYFKKWIGGYTGDCLGATQQVVEIVFYVSWIVLWKFI